MIYTNLTDEVIKQGDIFYPLPIPYIDPSKIIHTNGAGEFECSDWKDIFEDDNMNVNIPLKNTWGIVASQDCDAVRAPIISFFAIDEFISVTKLSVKESDKWWTGTITRKQRDNARWFYLPIDEKIGFIKRMAINFRMVFQVDREYLENNVQILRKCRLNEISYQHYRESIAQYFRRYPYDEWYPLTKNEFEEYKKANSDANIPPFDWQK